MNIELKDLPEEYIEAELLRNGMLTPFAGWDELWKYTQLWVYERYQHESLEDALTRHFNGSVAEYVHQLLQLSGGWAIAEIYRIPTQWLDDNYWRLHEKYTDGREKV